MMVEEEHLVLFHDRDCELSWRAPYGCFCPATHSVNVNSHEWRAMTVHEQAVKQTWRSLAELKGTQ